ncbi:hypothetical protein G6F35_011999 [Rhizopus arrhizus]|nr:hypothetical protein G6F31_019231 [Rhizopus arrhizus]KAG1204504.1 hypothetical protein G6F35_011999 [Rhizopus arrhizus]
MPPIRNCAVSRCSCAADRRLAASAWANWARLTSTSGGRLPVAMSSICAVAAANCALAWSRAARSRVASRVNNGALAVTCCPRLTGNASRRPASDEAT